MSAEQSLEDLILAASEKEVENEEAVERLSARIAEAEPSKLKEMASNFEFLIDAWDESVFKSPAKCKVCLQLAELSVIDTANFRNALNDAIRKGLPPYLCSPGVIKAVGARDSAISPREVSMRLKRIQHIKTAAILYQFDTHRWGKVTSIDKVTATLGVGPIGGTGGSTSSLSFASALGAAVFFEPSPEMLNMISPDKRNIPTAPRFRNVFAKYALTDISESKLRDIAMRIFIPEIMTTEAFATWWADNSATTNVVKAGSKRSPADARSVLELHTLLKPEEASGGFLADEEATAKLAKLMNGLKRPMQPKDVDMLAECIAMLVPPNKAPFLKTIFEPLLGKAPFWPAPPFASVELKNLETWARLSIKNLENFIKASAILYGQDDLAKLGAKLPLRCMGPLFDTLPQENVSAAISMARPFSSDALMWLWKNRSKVGKALASIIDLNTVMEALIQDGMPKEWGVAQRELKRTLFDKADFQKFMIENADGDTNSIIAALQKIPRIRNFQPGEQQSILVKFSRLSPELKEQFEGGEGKKLMVSASQTGAQQAESQQVPITSLASFKRLGKELEDIIKIHIPENVAAITHARGFGDFRENAEYDAAKERRRFLNRRKAELEQLVAGVQPTDFKDVKIEGKAVLGSTVTLESAGKLKDYYLVGAWDGDPEKSMISYRTKMGEALMGAKVGDSIELPETGKAVLKNVAPLPEKMRAALAGDK